MEPVPTHVCLLAASAASGKRDPLKKTPCAGAARQAHAGRVRTEVVWYGCSPRGVDCDEMILPCVGAAPVSPCVHYRHGARVADDEGMVRGIFRLLTF